MTADVRAAGVLDDARRAFLNHVEEERLRLYRTALQAEIRHASPLSVTFATHLGMSLDEVLQVMAPPSFWPPKEGSLLPPQARWDLSVQKGRWGALRDVDSLRWRLLRGGGFAYRLAGGADFIGWKVVDDAVEAAMRFERAVAMTRRGTLRLWLLDGLPETIVAALPGRPLVALVDHPILASGGWTIAAVQNPVGGGHVVLVKTGQRPFAAPWPELVAKLMIRPGAPSLTPRHLQEA